MKDGSYTYYVIQAQAISQTSSKDPNGKFIPTKDRSWFEIGDNFDDATDPWNPKKYGYKLYKDSSDDKHSCWAHTGSRCGWWSLKYAKAAIKRARKYSRAGKFNYRDGYNNLIHKTKYKFRLTKIEINKSTKILKEKRK